MDIWIYWVVAALILFIVELFTSGFAIICLSIGAAGGAIAAAAGGSIEIQLLVFAITSMVALLGVRPILKRTFYRRAEVATNQNAMIGKRGTVCVDIDAEGESGRVMIEGVDWRAVSATGEPIASGTKVVVTAIESVVLTVKAL
ncbi:MAG: NfeD family protein [Alistipes sp.]|nr:NfeD family protein [Alistipes sp.]